MLDLGAGVCRREPGVRGVPSRAARGRRGSPDPTRPTAPPASSGRKPRFEGSDRQGRGRLVEALRRTRRGGAGPAVMGWPDDPGRPWLVARRRSSATGLRLIRRSAAVPTVSAQNR